MTYTLVAEPYSSVQVRTGALQVDFYCGNRVMCSLASCRTARLTQPVRSRETHMRTAVGDGQPRRGGAPPASPSLRNEPRTPSNGGAFDVTMSCLVCAAKTACCATRQVGPEVNHQTNIGKGQSRAPPVGPTPAVPGHAPARRVSRVADAGRRASHGASVSDHRTARALGAVRWRCLSSSVAVGAHAPSPTWALARRQKPAQLARRIKRL